MGMLPVGLAWMRHAVTMLERARTGELATLSLFGVNPVRNAPDPGPPCAKRSGASRSSS